MVGLVPSLGLKAEINSGRIGLKIQIPKIEGRWMRHRTLREKGLMVVGAKLYNSLPCYLREHQGTYDLFKTHLDEYLETLPDTPSVGQLKSHCMDKDMKSSNSLKDWAKVILTSKWEPDSVTKQKTMESANISLNKETDVMQAKPEETITKLREAIKTTPDVTHPHQSTEATSEDSTSLENTSEEERKRDETCQSDSSSPDSSCLEWWS